MSVTEDGYSAKSIRSGMIAGYSAGICGIVVGYPLDSIKVLLQTQGKSGIGSHFDHSHNALSAKSNGGNADTAITRAASTANHSMNTFTNATPSSLSKANVSTSTMNPFDNIASKSQANSVLRTRSIQALYAGMTGPLLAAGTIRSINFAIYDSVRRSLYQHQLRSENSLDFIPGHRHHDDYLRYDNLSNVAVASFVSGGITSVATSPIALVKTKQQIMVWGFRKAVADTYYNGSSGKSILGGIRNFFVGFGAHFFCDAIGTAVYFTSYEYFKREISRRKNSSSGFEKEMAESEHSITLLERMACAASAGMVCWTVIFPWDVIRSRLYAQAIKNETSYSGFELARHMVKEQGIFSFYRGMGITVARAGPVAAAVLPVYDYVLSSLSSET